MTFDSDLSMLNDTSASEAPGNSHPFLARLLEGSRRSALWLPDTLAQSDDHGKRRSATL
jgi:hypothetical protein